MIGTLLGKLGGWFSPSFWVGNYLPVLAAAVLNALVAAAVFPQIAWLDVLEGKDLPHAAAVGFAIFLISYFAGPFAKPIEWLLDGSALPPFLADNLRLVYTDQAETARRQRSDTLRAWSQFDQLASPAIFGSLQQSRAAGMAAGVAADPALIGVAETHMAALWDSLRDGKLPEAAAANLAVAEMGAALAGNPTWVPAGDPRAADANRLDQAHTDLLRALNACLEGAKMRYTVATDRWRWLDIDYPRPTRFGNVKAVVEAYPKRVYEVDFYYLWPRLQLVMAKDQEAPSALILARAQVDFALLFLALMTLSWAFWMVLLPAWRTGSLVFLAVSIIGPFLIAAGYQLAIAAEREFGDVMKASIDRNRLEVLKMLKQKKPVGLFAERDLWRRLQKAERAAQAEEIIYSSE